MEILLTIICILSVAVNVYLIHTMKTQQFSDDDIDKIKQVVNILSWGGEDENQN